MSINVGIGFEIATAGESSAKSNCRRVRAVTLWASYARVLVCKAILDLESILSSISDLDLERERGPQFTNSFCQLARLKRIVVPTQALPHHRVSRSGSFTT